MKNSAAHRAYLDLARTVNYSQSTSQQLAKKSKEEAKAFREQKKKLVDSVCESLYSLPAGDFDTWHKEKCDVICNKMNGSGLLGKTFTYGQAQKWVNMTLKYLWLLDLLPKEIKEESLHVPIDSFILQKLKEEQVSGVTGSGETYYYKGKVWSAITDYEEEYMELQKEIRRIASPNPIQWEDPAWIEVAKKRRNK